MKDMVDHGGILFLALDTKGTVTFVNQTTCDILQFRKNEIIGRDWFDQCLPETHRDKEKSSFIQIIEEKIEPLQNCEKQILTKKGEERTIMWHHSLLRDRHRKITGLLCSGHDITQWKKRMDTFRKDEAMLQSIFRSAPVGIGVVRSSQDASSRILSWCNERLLRMTGYSSEDLIGKSARVLYPTEEDYDFVGREKYKQIGKSGTGTVETRWKRKNGTIIDILLSSTPINLTNFEEGVTFTALDITERKKAEERLRLEKDFSLSLVDTANAIIITLDVHANIVIFNRFAETLTGYQKEKVIGKNWFKLFIPERDRSNIPEVFHDVLQQMPHVSSHENPIRCKNGEERLISWRNTIVKDNIGKITGVLSVGVDITERIQAEEKIKTSLKEKEILLKEIHHRVKNNLQIIMSLLKLQSRYIEDQKASDMFRESENRIRAMAMVHEELYRSQDLARIPFNQYIKSLVMHLYQIYKLDSRAVDLQIDVQDIAFGIDVAIPYGLIINELISNALKHAFPPSFQGKAIIGVSLKQLNKEKTELAVWDNGRGLPGDVDIRKTESLGMRLVVILSEEQLNGKLRVERTGGTKVIIEFENG